MKQRILSFQKKWMIVAALSAGFFFTACNKDDNGDDVDTPLAGVMAFNLVPDGKSIGFVSGSSFITNGPLVFNSYTGGYLGILPGSRTIGAVNLNGGGSLASETFTFEADKYYSVFLVGADPDYDQVIVEDDLNALSTTTQAFVRYINAIPDASSPNVTIAVNGTNVINEQAPFKNVSAFTALDPGSVTITVSNGSTINVTRTITLEVKKVYTILLSGKPGDTGATEVQIKFIQNGTVDDIGGRIGTAGGGTLN